MKNKERPVSLWEILEIAQSASDSVKPAAVKIAQKIFSIEITKRREPTFPNLIGEEEPTESLRQNIL